MIDHPFHLSIREQLHFFCICRDTDEDLTHTNQMLSDLDLTDVARDADKSVCRYVCAALAIRATQYISACTYTSQIHTTHGRFYYSPATGA